MPAESDAREGYCRACWDFHLLFPLPDGSFGICGNCQSAGRVDPSTWRGSNFRPVRVSRRRLRHAAEVGMDLVGDGSGRGVFGEERIPWRIRIRRLLAR